MNARNLPFAVGDRSPRADQLTVPVTAGSASPTSLRTAYPLARRLRWTTLAVVVGVAVAGFWNYKVVDGFGRELVAGSTIGNTQALAGAFGQKGLEFGFIFAVVAGLAATFTACNCVVFAMLPGLACSTDRSASRRHALKALGVFAAGVVIVGALYGAYVGTIGPDNVRSYNAVRLPQAETTFTILGTILILWGLVEFGYLDGLVTRVPEATRRFFASPFTRAGLMGLLVGFFAVGRPFPVFRDFLAYAATAYSPLYGAVVMSLQGLGQIALMVAIFLAVTSLFGERLARWVAEKPFQPTLISAVALVVGGSYFVYYWGLALLLGVGSWGFKLGLYH